ncbi:MAG: polysaccharide biosynthesis C-terminal domain-containing protein, partial [Pedosphaera parvula]|nr:polysaccharide biosynthesis C-terminal domain-containing protein [Pedosphaera parvula]
AFQLPTLRREGFRYRWEAPWNNESVRLVVVRMIPGTIGVAAFQINILLTQSIAFWLDPTIVASFNYAVRLMELPQGVFGISLATFLLPTLSGLAAEKKFEDFRALLGQGLDHLVFVNLLASVLLLTAAEPIIRLLFERGLFSADATARAAYALACLAPGLVAFSMVNILARAFFALGDTTTPMKISVACLVFNFVLVLLLIVPYRQGGLGLANTASAILNVVLLYRALRRKLPVMALTELRRNIAPTLLAVTLAGGLCWFLSRQWEMALGHAGLHMKLGAVFAPLTAAALLYWGVALVLKVDSVREITALIGGKLGLRSSNSRN